MVTKLNAAISHRMTQESIDAFLERERDSGASDNAMRRFRGTLRAFFSYLPEDKLLTKERLLAWREDMRRAGYASVTVLNYVKNMNRYLDFVGCSQIRFRQGKGKDIAGMTFGYLTAIEPTGGKHRADNVWLFRCQCGKTVELPATRAIVGNTLSCGCLVGKAMMASRKYYDGTSLVQSITENVFSEHAVSGYTGVSPKGDKWQATIKYKGVSYYLGSYWDLQEAVKARARAKELVIADAQGLLDFYTELVNNFPQLPNRKNEPKREFPSVKWIAHPQNFSAALRSDNTSGVTGVCRRNGKYEARICYKGIRYLLGTFETKDEAAVARQEAEDILADDPDRFVKEFAAVCRNHSAGTKRQPSGKCKPEEL